MLKLSKYFTFILSVFIIGLTITKAKPNVTITDIKLIEKSTNTTILKEPNANNLNINFDLDFKELNDYVKYEITIKNEDAVDYQISSDTSFNTSQYLSYKYEVTDILKAHSQTKVNIIITYFNKISENSFSNGQYQESNQASIKLLNEQDVIINPQTTAGNLILICLAIILSVILILLILRHQKIAKYLSLILISFSLINPLITKALESLNINVRTNITISKAYSVYYEMGVDNFIISEDDLNEFTLLDIECDKEYLLLKESNKESKYYMCYYQNPNSKSKRARQMLLQTFFKSKKLYRVGESVTLKKIVIYEYDFKEESVLKKEGYFEIYPEYLTEAIYNNWLYDRYDNNLLTDAQLDLKFTNNLLFDNWNDDNVTVTTPNEFIMPNHDVYFRYLDLPSSD